jgi:hypothetical protein
LNRASARAGAIGHILTDAHGFGTLWFGVAGITAVISDDAPRLRIFFPFRSIFNSHNSDRYGVSVCADYKRPQLRLRRIGHKNVQEWITISRARDEVHRRLGGWIRS